MSKTYYDTPLWDSSLSIEERLDYLLSGMTLEEKIQSMGTGNPEIERLGVPAFQVGGEAAHGVQARHDQEFDVHEPDLTTIFQNPIGMSASFDEELIRKAGKVVGTEVRGLYSREHEGILSVWAPTIDMERDPRWGRTEEAYGEDPLLTGKMAGAYVEGLQGEDDQYLLTAATLKHFYANNVEDGRVWKSSTISPRNKWEYYLEPFRQVIKEHGAEALMTAYNEINGVPGMLNPEVQRILKDQWGLHHVVCDGADVSQTVDFHHYYATHADTIVGGLAAGIDCFTDSEEMVWNAVREALEDGKITPDDLTPALRCHYGTLIRLGFFDAKGENPYASVGMKDVGTKANQAVSRKMATEGVVLLQNKQMLPLDPEEDIAVIGPLADVWYKDWYSGIPPYFVTPLDGIRSQSNVAFERAALQAHIGMADGSYLGVDNGGVVCRADFEHAALFELECWDDEQVTIRFVENGKLLTVEDDFAKGQEGLVTASKDEPFGWFVKEIFHLTNVQTAEAAITEQHGICADVSISAWNGAALCFDELGRLSVAKRKDQVLDDRIGVAGTTDQHSVEQTAGLPIVIERVRSGLQEAKKLAACSGKVVLVLGANPMINGKEEIDRKDLNLPPYQSRLLKEITDVNPNVVLVLISSVPFALDWAAKNVPAILISATGSMEIGNALADILFGQESPAGRLPMTWYSEKAELPDMDDYDIIQGERTYQYYNGKPVYAFGHGLTYGEIRYEKMTVSRDMAELFVNVTISNNGRYTTDEVVQIYGHKVQSAVKRPHRQLIDFRRVKQIRPGEKRTVTFHIPQDRMKYFDVISREMVLEDGMYEIYAGASSANLPLRQEISLRGVTRGVRHVGEPIYAEYFDTSSNVELIEGNPIASRTDVWIPAGDVSLATPDRRDREMTLTFADTELPTGKNNEICVTVQEWPERKAPWVVRALVDGQEIAVFQSGTHLTRRNTGEELGTAEQTAGKLGEECSSAEQAAGKLGEECSSAEQAAEMARHLNGKCVSYTAYTKGVKLPVDLHKTCELTLQVSGDVAIRSVVLQPETIKGNDYFK